MTSRLGRLGSKRADVLLPTLFLFALVLAPPALAQSPSASQPEPLGAHVSQSAPPAPIQPNPAPPVPAEDNGLNPLMQRYVFDELKQLRSELLTVKAEMIKEITQRELEVADKALNYSFNSVTLLFYVVAVAGALLALVGWRSLHDLKNSVKSQAEREIQRLSKEYEKRLSALEQELQDKGEVILSNQREIERTQMIHALWLQSHQAPNPRAKIELYDRLLDLSPGDAEVMVYKADAALQLGERDWALSLCNRVIDDHPEMSLAYYQRACAYAGLGQLDSAVENLARAIDLSESLRQQALTETDFETLWETEEFQKLVGGNPAEINSEAGVSA